MAETQWDSEELATLKARLLDRIADVRADIQRELRKAEGEHYADLADRVADTGEQSVADLLVDVDLAEITRDVVELRELEEALLRLAHGAYGVCIDCGAPIEAARLHYTPGASRCVPCQQRFEAQTTREQHTTL